MMSRGALLRRRRRHLRHRRAGHQGPVHAERRHQELPPVEPVLGRQRHAAAGDGRSVRRQGHRLRRRRVRGRARRPSSATAARCSSTPTASTSRRRASRRRSCSPAWRRCCRRTSGSTSCRSRAWRSSARSSCSRAARSTTWPRVKAQVDYIKERVPGAEVYVHPHTRRGGRDRRRDGDAAAWSSARGHSTFIGIDAAIDLEFTATNDESTRCHFCPNNCARTFIDTKTPDGRTAPLHLAASRCEKGTVESRRGDARAHQGAQEADEGVPEPGRLRGEAASSGTSTTRSRCPSDGDADRRTSRSRRRCSSGVKKTRRSQRNFQRSAPRRARAAPRDAHRHPARCSTSGSTAPFFRTYFEALGHAEAERRVLRRDLRGDVGRGRQVRLDRSLLPVEGRRRRTSTTCSSTTTAEERRSSKYIFFPCITHVPPVRRTSVMDTASCPIVAGAPEVMKAAFTKETDFFAAARHQLRRSGAHLHRADAAASAQLFEAWGPLLGRHRGRERLRLRRRAGRRCDIARRRPAEQGHGDPRDGRGGEPRRGADDRPARTTRTRA